MWQVQILARALYADIFFVGVLVDVVRDDDVPAVGIFLYEFCLAVMSHVHYGVTLRFDYVVDPADDIICIVGVNVVPCVYEMSSSRAEKINAFFQAADDVGVFACPSHQFFRPLEMDDVIGLVRLPEFLCGTSHVNTCHSDSITQYRYEQIARISVFSKDDERCYRRTACIFTVIHVFLF